MLKKIVKGMLVTGLVMLISISSLEKGLIMYDAINARKSGAEDMILENEDGFFRYALHYGSIGRYYRFSLSLGD